MMYPSTSRCIVGKTAVPIMILARVSKTTYGRGGKDMMHQYTLEFLEEWWKQE
jgi:hypothetical protein